MPCGFDGPPLCFSEQVLEFGVIPEALKPRTISIRSGNEQKTIEAKKAA
jgi:hypothetical protein